MLKKFIGLQAQDNNASSVVHISSCSIHLHHYFSITVSQFLFFFFEMKQNIASFFGIINEPDITLTPWQKR